MVFIACSIAVVPKKLRHLDIFVVFVSIQTSQQCLVSESKGHTVLLNIFGFHSNLPQFIYFVSNCIFCSNNLSFVLSFIIIAIKRKIVPVLRFRTADRSFRPACTRVWPFWHFLLFIFLSMCYLAFSHSLIAVCELLAKCSFGSAMNRTTGSRNGRQINQDQFAHSIVSLMRCPFALAPNDGARAMRRTM